MNWLKIYYQPQINHDEAFGWMICLKANCNHYEFSLTNVLQLCYYFMHQAYEIIFILSTQI